MDNVVLFTHIGGDGAHFLIWLLHETCSGMGDQWDPYWKAKRRHPYNIDNDYRWIDGVVNNENTTDATEIINSNISAGYLWHSNMEPTPVYNNYELFIQQMHSLPSKCSKKTIPTKLLSTSATFENIYLFSLLDIAKNKKYSDNFDKSFLNSVFHRGEEYLDIALGRPMDDLPIHYINYDKLFLNQDLDEFANLTDFLGLTIVSEKDKIKEHIIRYVDRNSRVLKKYNLYIDHDKLKYIIDKYHSA